MGEGCNESMTCPGSSVHYQPSESETGLLALISLMGRGKTPDVAALLDYSHSLLLVAIG